MSLTSDDLQAIKGIVENIVDDAKEEIKIDVAAGFTEVHEKIDGLRTDVDELRTDVDELKTDMAEVKDTVSRIEDVQRAEVARVDDHAERIAKLEAKTA